MCCCRVSLSLSLSLHSLLPSLPPPHSHREALFKYPRLRPVYLSLVIAALPSVADSRSIRSLLWVIGEFGVETGSIVAAVQSIATGLGELPMLAAEERHEASLRQSDQDDGQQPPSQGTHLRPRASTRVLADGTYASENALTMTEAAPVANNNLRQLPNIKSKKGVECVFKCLHLCCLRVELLLEGKFECSGVLANALTKLVIRMQEGGRSEQTEAVRLRALLIMTSILRLGGSKYPASPIDQDSAERIALCIQLLLAEEGDARMGALRRAFTADSEAAFTSVLQRETATVKNAILPAIRPAIGDVIDFGLVSTPVCSPRHADDKNALSLLLVGSNASTSSGPSPQSSNDGALSRVVQLTGFSDPIYAETYVQVTRKDIYLDVLLVNQTEETLQSVSVDLNCAGDLKLAEKPPAVTLPPLGFASCKAVVRVTATNHGQIFGCISYLTGASGQEADSVILAEVKIDVLEYIHPATVSETVFRDLWVLLEWENKISIRIASGTERWAGAGLRGFLDSLLLAGHLACITPNAGLESGGTASFLACNLYAKSIFDEEILANMCLELEPTGAITGHLRLRSKTQGLAIAFGDKLNALLHQK